MTKAEEIIELFKREPFHPDPQVHQQILKTSIEDILYEIELGTKERIDAELDEIQGELDDLKIDYKALEEEVKELRQQVDAA